MELKLDGEGHAVLKDGMPVYKHADGTEAPFDAAATVQSVRARTEQSKRVEAENKDLTARLKAFEGIDDPVAALKALGTVKNLDDKKLVDAGQVETVKAEVNKVWEGKYGELQKQRDLLEQQLFGEVIGGAFARSKYIAEKLILPPDIAQAAFGKHFKVEGGKLRVFAADGSPIFSKKNAGAEVSDFDEAIEILVEANPQKDRILKADNGSGSGAQHSRSANGDGRKTVTRAEFDSKDPAAKQKLMREGVQVIDK